MFHICSMDDYPCIVTPEQLRFDISFALKKVSRATLREWASTNDLKSDRAREAMVVVIMDQLSRYQVRAREAIPPPWIDR